MLKKTFLHLPRVGQRTEAYSWRRGLLTWEDILMAPRVPGLGWEGHARPRPPRNGA